MGRIHDLTLPAVVTVPGPPTSVVPVAGDGEVLLSWAAPLSDGGAPITGYKVEYRTSAVTSLSIAQITGFASPSNEDQALRSFLESLGHTVTVFDDSDPVNTAGIDLAFVSESVLSGTLAGKWLDTSVPVINFESFALNDIVPATGNWAAGDGVVNVQTTGHYLAGSTFTLTGQTPGTDITLTGVPADLVSNASAFGAGFEPILSLNSGAPTTYLAGVYPSGSILQGGGIAPANYAWAGIGEDALGVLTDDARQLIEDLINWAVPPAGGTAGPWINAGTVATLTDVVTGLTNDTAYDFRICAENSEGFGLPSAIVVATPTSGAGGGGGGPVGTGDFATFLNDNHYDGGTPFDLSNVPAAQIAFWDAGLAAAALEPPTVQGANGFYRNEAGVVVITDNLNIPRVGADAVKIERGTRAILNGFVRAEGPINLTPAVHSDGIQTSFAGGLANTADVELNGGFVINTVSQNEVHGQGIKTGDGANGGAILRDGAFIGGLFPLRLQTPGTYILDNVWLFAVRAIEPFNGYSTYDETNDFEQLIISASANVGFDHLSAIPFDVKLVNSDGTVRRLRSDGSLVAYP